MILAVIWGLLVGNLVQVQFTYDKCKETNFEGVHCEVAKKLEATRAK